LDNHHHQMQFITRKSTTEILVLLLFFNAEPPKIAEAVEKFKPVLQFLNSHLEHHRFVAGEHISIADYIIIPELDQLVFLGLINLNEFPHLNRWFGEATNSIHSLVRSAVQANICDIFFKRS